MVAGPIAGVSLPLERTAAAAGAPDSRPFTLAFPADPLVRLAERVAARAPIYRDLVPKGLKENLEYRRRVMEWAARSEENKRILWMACKRDLLFWVGTFCWTFDPRRTEVPELPFIPYAYQEGALLRLAWCVGRTDLWIEKSRDMGMTWMVMLVFVWRFVFWDSQTFLVTSRKEDLVDSPGDPDCLFAKVDFLLERLPGWMRPNVTRTHLHFGNDDNGSVLDGESSTGDAGRGGRRTCTFHDEFASDGRGAEVLAATADVARSRFFGSTPKPSGAFYDRIRKPDTLKLTLHWKDHPEKNKGLYRSRDGKLEIVDKAYEFPADYPFVLDGRLRSIAYDKECDRRRNMREMAQEWDIEYLGSGYQFFDSVEIQRLLDGPDATVRPPKIGRLDWDRETMEPGAFVIAPGGTLRLWVALDASGRPPSNTRYVVGADISAGTGASNSVASVVDRMTGEKVAEFVTPLLSPEDFGVAVVVLCNWFRGSDGMPAYLAWEANGPGRQFEKRVLQSGFRNVYFDRRDRSIVHKVTDKPGWYSNDENKLVVLGDYRESLGRRSFINRSEDALRETLAYNYTPGGTVAHAEATTTSDPSGARDNHGDRVIADALANMVLGYLSADVAEAPEKKTPPGWSYASRRREYEDKRNVSGWRNRGAAAVVSLFAEVA